MFLPFERSVETSRMFTYSRKNNDYSRSYNIKHCSADNTYYFAPKISNIVSEKEGALKECDRPVCDVRYARPNSFV